MGWSSTIARLEWSRAAIAVIYAHFASQIDQVEVRALLFGWPNPGPATEDQ
jgi:hypothetical protein